MQHIAPECGDLEDGLVAAEAELDGALGRNQRLAHGVAQRKEQQREGDDKDNGE